MTSPRTSTSPRKLVSIVLPVYNGSRYLRQSIESCMSQTYENIELIVVDDASKDDSVEIVRAYRDPRIALIRHERNRKLPAALNTGFRAASGAYLTWTSHDNYYIPTAIDELVQFLESRMGVDFVYSDEYIIDERDQTVQLDRTGPVERLVEQSCLGGCFLYTRAVYERLGPYDERLFLAEDYDYWLRALAAFKLAHLDRPLYYYRLHPRSLTVQFQPEGVDLALRVRRRLLGRYPWRYGRALSRAHIAGALLFRNTNRRRAAAVALGWALLFDPAALRRPDVRVLLAQLCLGRRGLTIARRIKRLIQDRPAPPTARS